MIKHYNFACCSGRSESVSLLPLSSNWSLCSHLDHPLEIFPRQNVKFSLATLVGNVSVCVWAGCAYYDLGFWFCVCGCLQELWGRDGDKGVLINLHKSCARVCEVSELPLFPRESCLILFINTGLVASREKRSQPWLSSDPGKARGRLTFLFLISPFPFPFPLILPSPDTVPTTFSFLSLPVPNFTVAITFPPPIKNRKKKKRLAQIQGANAAAN